MVTPAASRFAVLPVDDDGDTSRRITAKMLKKKDEQPKMQNSLGNTKPDQSKKKANGKKKQDSQGNSTNKVKSKSQTNKKKASQDQWEEWKQKDAEFVDCHYEDELQQAMLLSKIDYEENKEYYKQIKKAAEEEKKAASKKNKKSNKAQPMSLSQFNQLGENENQPEVASLAGGDDILNGNEDLDPEFFDRIMTDAKKALQTEKAEEQRKAREPLIDEIISVNQYKDRLEKCHEEIESLKNENTRLTDELMNVKTRNKKLCQILLQGEMKDKAQVLVEVDKLQRVRDELSTEVSSLVAQLEQEKSKVRALTESKDKPVHKKNVRFNAASETARSK